MKHLFNLVCILTPFGVNHALFCAQRVMAIAETQLKNEITQEAYNLYTIQIQSNENNTINTITSNTSPSSNTLSAQTSGSLTDVSTVVLTQDSSPRKPLKCFSLRASKQPTSAPASQESSPAQKPRILKSYSKSAPASPESSPTSDSRQINSTPSIRPVTLTSEQVKNTALLALPKIIRTASAQTEELPTPRKKTLKGTTSFYQSSSSSSSTSAPVTSTKQAGSVHIPQSLLHSLKRANSESQFSPTSFHHHTHTQAME